MDSHPLPIVGLILAGGDGTRLGGVRKADLRLANMPLRQWVTNRLAPQCAQIFLSDAHDRPARPDQPSSLPDSPDGVQGPAAGLLAGARWCAVHAPNALLLSVSTDTPFFPTDFAAKARPLFTPEVNCVVGAYGDRDYPIVALWRPAPLLAQLQSYPKTAKGPRIRDIQNAIGKTQLDYAATQGENPFAGINTLADLLALSRRVKNSPV